MNCFGRSKKTVGGYATSAADTQTRASASRPSPSLSDTQGRALESREAPPQYTAEDPNPPGRAPRMGTTLDRSVVAVGPAGQVPRELSYQGRTFVAVDSHDSPSRNTWSNNTSRQDSEKASSAKRWTDLENGLTSLSSAAGHLAMARKGSKHPAELTTNEQIDKRLATNEAETEVTVPKEALRTAMTKFPGDFDWDQIEFAASKKPGVNINEVRDLWRARR